MEEKASLAVVVSLLALVVWAVVYVAFSLVATGDCAKAGYPEVTVDFYFNGYCVDKLASEGKRIVSIESLSK